MKRIRDRIIDCLKELDRPISPLELSKIIKANPNSVRSLLTPLVRESILYREARGLYSHKPIDVVGELPRLQNLFFIAENVKVRKSEDLRFRHDFPDGGYFQIRLMFGVKRGRISWSASAPDGIDLYGLITIRMLVESECETRGFRIAKWNCRKIEFLRDYDNVRFEGGLKAVTLTDVEGYMEKFYQKDESVVRHETRAQGDVTSVDNLIGLLQGGVPTYRLVQSVGMLSKTVEAMAEALKMNNRLVNEALVQNRELFEQNRRILEALYRIVDERS